MYTLVIERENQDGRFSEEDRIADIPMWDCVGMAENLAATEPGLVVSYDTAEQIEEITRRILEYGEL